MTARYAAVPELARAFSAYLDGSYPADLCTEARLWRRVTKVDEETGEVQEALRAYLGENPRKPRGPIEDVIKELADVAACALGALEHVTGNEGRSLQIVLDRLRYTCERAGVAPGKDSHGYCPGCGVSLETCQADQEDGEFCCTSCPAVKDRGDGR